MARRETSDIKTHVVGLDEISGKDLPGSNTTVVRTLRSGETTLGPSERLTVRVEKSVLLLETEPRLLLADQVHVLLAKVPVVVGCRRTVGEVTGTQDKDVVTSTERVGEDGTGPQEDVRVGAGCLFC